MRLAFAATWHQLQFEELQQLLHSAEQLGYEAAYLDGDVSAPPRGHKGEVLDGWSAQIALALSTKRIRIAAPRLAHYWPAARLAQATATLERIAPRRQRVLIMAGGQPRNDARFGIPPAANYAARLQHLHETLSALRALWRGGAVQMQGRFVQLQGARITPAPRPPPPVEVAAIAPRSMAAVAKYADAWNINAPPGAPQQRRAEAALARACAELGRAPQSVERCQWLFARPDARAADAALPAEYRRFAPWFAAQPNSTLAAGILCGGAQAARAQLQQLRAQLQLDLPVADVTGLPLAAAQRALEMLAPN